MFGGASEFGTGRHEGGLSRCLWGGRWGAGWVGQVVGGGYMVIISHPAGFVHGFVGWGRSQQHHRMNLGAVWAAKICACHVMYLL